MNNMDSIWGFVGILVLACGVYAVYSLIRMRTSGEINASLLLGKEYMYKKCKDKEGFIQKASPALLLLGIVAIAYGIIDTVNCYVYPMPKLDAAGMTVFFLVLVWFAVYTAKIKKQYF